MMFRCSLWVFLIISLLYQGSDKGEAWNVQEVFLFSSINLKSDILNVQQFCDLSFCTDLIDVLICLENCTNSMSYFGLIDAKMSVTKVEQPVVIYE